LLVAVAEVVAMEAAAEPVAIEQILDYLFLLDLLLLLQLVAAEPVVLTTFPGTESLDQILFLTLLHQLVVVLEQVIKVVLRAPEGQVDPAVAVAVKLPALVALLLLPVRVVPVELPAAPAQAAVVAVEEEHLELAQVLPHRVAMAAPEFLV
jgi:hypothetical protein